MRRKNLWLFLLPAAAVVASVFAISAAETRAVTGERYMSASYQRAFSELASSVDDIGTGLRKCMYSSVCEGVAPAAADVFGRAMAAQMCLAELPLSNYELEDTSSFISRAGDYSFAIALMCSRGIAPSESDRENLMALSSAAEALAQRLAEMQARVADGSLSVSELYSSERAADEAAPDGLTGGFKKIESEFPEVPSLIYDGPFSQHLTGRSPRMTEGLEECGEEQALQSAADFLGLESSQVRLLAERDGDLPAYLITALSERGEKVVTVTKRGALVSSVFSVSHEPGGEGEISVETALGTAKDFLSSRGFPEMKDSYWIMNGSSAIFNFAYEQDGVICYTDLVKVAVSLEDGSVVGFEALGYLMNHRERELPEAEVGVSEAESKLSPSLTVLSRALAVIPSSGENEVFCREFKCADAEGRHYIVYIDALTGLQSKMLILLEDESGTLTI